MENENVVTINDLPSMKCNLTTAGIKEWFEEIGIICRELPSEIQFILNDEVYSLFTVNLPVVSLSKIYKFLPETEELFERALDKVDKNICIVKCQREKDDAGSDDNMVFLASWIEGSLEHFKTVFREYILFVENAVNYVVNVANEMEREAQSAELYSESNEL